MKNAFGLNSIKRNAHNHLFSKSSLSTSLTRISSTHNRCSSSFGKINNVASFSTTTPPTTTPMPCASKILSKERYLQQPATAANRASSGAQFFSKNQKMMKGSSIENRRTFSTSFGDPMYGQSPAYVEGMYNSWKSNPSSVHQSWASYFDAMERGYPVGMDQSSYQKLATLVNPPSLAYSASLSDASQRQHFDVNDSMKLLLLVRAYQGLRKIN